LSSPFSSPRSARQQARRRLLEYQATSSAPTLPQPSSTNGKSFEIYKNFWFNNHCVVYVEAPPSLIDTSYRRKSDVMLTSRRMVFQQARRSTEFELPQPMTSNIVDNDQSSNIECDFRSSPIRRQLRRQSTPPSLALYNNNNNNNNNNDNNNDNDNNDNDKPTDNNENIVVDKGTRSSSSNSVRTQKQRRGSFVDNARKTMDNSVLVQQRRASEAFIAEQQRRGSETQLMSTTSTTIVSSTASLAERYLQQNVCRCFFVIDYPTIVVLI
jgi:hypothetical protein